MRFTGRGVVMGASLSALVLVASGCTGAPEEEPTPSFASSTADAEPNPELTEPPYETELNLTPDEKKAADEAYDVLVNYIKSNNEVLADSGGDPDRALQYTSGELRDKQAEEYESMTEKSEVGVGGVTHTYHRLEQLDLRNNEPSEAIFESCVDFSHFDILDRDGNSLAGVDTGPTFTIYTLQLVGRDWKNVDIEFPEFTCD